jgi:hypothetical protein
MVNDGVVIQILPIISCNSFTFFSHITLPPLLFQAMAQMEATLEKSNMHLSQVEASQI